MDTNKYPEGLQTYYKDNHTIDVQQNQVIILDMYAAGSGRGSGERLKVKHTNATEEVITFDLVVGTKGQGWKNGGDSGTDGGIGFVIVTTS